MTNVCATVRRDLGAFLDGELRAPARMRTFQHLQTCASCASRVEELRELGDLLRASSEAHRPDHAGMDGLAATVIARTRAEVEGSWLGTYRRATEDWHWLLVGSGSVAATLAVTLLVSAVLAFGPKPQRSGSLASIVVDLTPPADAGDYLFAEVLRPGSDEDPLTVQVDSGGPRASVADLVLVSNSPTNAEVVGALFDVSNQRHTPCASSEMCRQAAENLSQRVTSTMLASGNPMATSYTITRLKLLTSVKAVYDRVPGS